MATVRDQHHSVVSGQSHHAAADLHIDVLLLSPRKWWHLHSLDILLFSPVLSPPVLPAGHFLAEQFGRGGEAGSAVQ